MKNINLYDPMKKSGAFFTQLLLLAVLLSGAGTVRAQRTLEFILGNTGANANSPYTGVTNHGNGVYSRTYTVVENTGNPANTNAVAYTPALNVTFTGRPLEGRTAVALNIGAGFDFEKYRGTSNAVHYSTLPSLIGQGINNPGASSGPRNIGIDAAGGDASFLGSSPYSYNRQDGPRAMGYLEVTFSRAVNNPIFHVSGFGASTNAALGFRLNPSLSTFTSATLKNSKLSDNTGELSGRGGLYVDDDKIYSQYYYQAPSSTAVDYNLANGSVQILGTGITKIVFDVMAVPIQANSTSWSIGGDQIQFSFSIPKPVPVSVSGTVYDDHNGLANSQLDGTPTNGGGLYAYLLYGNETKVQAKTAVAANGTYTLNGELWGDTSVKVAIRPDDLAIGDDIMASAPPAGYDYIGAIQRNENNGTGQTSTPTSAALSTITNIPNADDITGAYNITGIDFGIRSQPVSLSKSVSPAAITDGGTATYTFTLGNNAAGSVAQGGLGFTDTLPGGLRIASTPNVVVTGLTGGSVTAVAGGTSVAVSGYSIAAGATATITVDVTNATGQLNPSCGSNPAAFTNSAANISGLSLNLANNVGNVCLAVYCAAGNTAPTLTNATVTSQTVNLSSMVTGMPPGTSVLQWHTTATPANDATLVNLPVTAAATPTNYYAVYYDSTSGCYSPAAKVIVASNNCTASQTTVDLTALPHAATAPDIEIVWYTTPARDAGTEVTDADTVGNGTYWPFFHDTINNCYSPAGTPVVVGLTICNAACYKPGITTGTALETKMGITALGRAGMDAPDNWPMVRKGGWIVLEAKTKGFVPNRVAFSDADSNPATPDVPVGISPANFVEGMMVYDTTNQCMKMYTLKEGDASMAWHCISTQTCPE